MLDYRNQNLRGEDFRGQDMTGADFSGADLRGVDFSGSTLNRARFSKARLGKPLRRRSFLLLASLVIGLGVSIFSAFGNFFLAYYFESIVSTFFQHQEYLVILASFVYLLGTSGSVYVSLKKQSWLPLMVFYIVISIAGAVYGGTEGSVKVAGAVAFGIIGSIGIAVGIGVAGVGALAGTLIGTALATGNVIGVVGDALTIMTLGIVLLGWFLKYRTLETEETLLLPLRHLSLKWQSMGSARFNAATLIECDFSGTDLKYANLSRCRFIRCNFQNSLNLHLANTLHTLLEPLAVRQLALTGKTEAKDFSRLDLRGVVFAGLDLQGRNFRNADLSEADLRGCNLSGCDFAEAIAYGTWFDNAEFTGANIDNWGIDKATQFSGASAKFVYLKRDQSERNPPEGEFKDGDFAKLYQEIANTVDFIAHTPVELQALLCAIEKIKAEGGDIFIQQMERKADSVVIRVQGEGGVELDKAAVYAEVERQKAVELIALRQEYEQKLLSQENRFLARENELKAQHNDLLAEFVRSALTKSTSVYVKNKNVMNDNSRSISNATIQNSAVSLGDNSSVINRIQQLPDNQNELKEVLTQLAALLEKSHIPSADKEKVEKEINNLAEIAPKSTEERKNSGSKIVATLKDLASIFKDLPEMGVKYGEIIAKLWMMF